MVKRTGRTTMIGIGIIAFVLATSYSGSAFAEEKPKPAKKPKASPEAKASKSKTDKPTYHTAEKAAQAKACFGEAPKIDKLTPDGGLPGMDQIGGTTDCVRGVSFGPGHGAEFKLKDERTITATVPKSGRKGLAIVTVTTASGEDSKPFLVK